MERMTKRQDGSVQLKDGYDAACALERLACYEDMREALLAERQKNVKTLEELKAEGKSATVTYRQLLANKLMLMNLLGRFEIYGL